MNWCIWIGGIASVLYAVLVCCCFSSLKVAIAVIETASDYFADTKRVIFVPILFFFVSIGIFAAWFISVLCVSSIGNITNPNALD